jgi:O-antigen/teichoic acid export membrane protein
MRRVKDLIILTGDRFVQFAILLVSSRVITTLLSPEQMGRFAIFYTTGAFFIGLFITGPSLYVERKVLEWNIEGSIFYYVRRFFYYLLLSGAASGIIILLFRHILGISVHFLWLIVLIFCIVSITSLNSSFISWLNIFKKRLLFMVVSNLTLLVGLAVSVFFVLLFSKTAEYWISGQILGQVLVIPLGAFLFFKITKSANRKINPLPDSKNYASTIFHFAWPVSLATLVLWLQTQSYRFILRGLSGLEVLGFFTVGFNLGTQLMGKFQSLFMNFYNPIFYEEITKVDSEKKAEAWNRYAQAFFPALTLAGIFIALGGPFIARLFVAEKFQEMAGNVIFWGALTSLVLTFVSTYKMVGVAQLEMKGLILPYSLGSVVALGGIFILSRWNPYWGTGLSLFLGAVTTLLYLIVKMHKLLLVRLPKLHLGISIVYSLPIAAIFIILRIFFPHPTLCQSVTILVISGIYLLFAQVLMARDWLFK